ncbi:MAG: glycoside hydrolase family 2 [Bacteroidaceae bacterium]|nr:glycoside hydrolase family 2 [Bacteroidaceae bacterium]
MSAQNSLETQRKYLSGHGCDDMVEWDFYCTKGNNSGKWTKIGVPSCWELQGFGTFQYGMKFYGKAFPEGIADEEGQYKYKFRLPKEWANHHIDLIFEAAMTDMSAKINGRKAVGSHQGGFYRITADVSDRVFFGDKENVLEVTVAKESKNAGVNLSERRADYWNFGGLWRPVFIECKPAINIERTVIDGQASGLFRAQVLVSAAMNGKVKTRITDLQTMKVVAEQTNDIRSGANYCDISMSVKSPKLWTAETPNRYAVEFTLIDAQGKTLHIARDKFGFRTIETREGDGMYINGKKVNIRGVNRHSFWPESGRTLSKQKNIDDVKMIKSMNMNSVRLSHYPADPEFYDACDSLGLYVMSELTGWHGHHETVVGRQLVKEMLTRDLNHPSVIWWSNGNEKGWNTELDCEFHKWDFLQKRPVIHPQGNFSGYETMHYRSYGETEEHMRRPQIFMPTEFLHALYDGGAGAGLYDYWKLMRSWKRCQGGFIWAFADEGVVRVDEGGRIDNVGNYGADGIVGPHHEKEGSYWTVKEIWSPVWFDARFKFNADFNGTIPVENRYDFLNLKDVRFDVEWIAFETGTDCKEKVVAKTSVTGLDIEPGKKGLLKTGSAPKDADALRIKATDTYGCEIFDWTYFKEFKELKGVQGDFENLESPKAQELESSQGVNSVTQGTTVEKGGVKYEFCAKTGQLKSVTTKKGVYPMKNGPRFFAYRRSDRSFDQFYNHDVKDAEKLKTTYLEYDYLGRTNSDGTTAAIDDRETLKSFNIYSGDTTTVVAEYSLGAIERVIWKIAPDGSAKMAFSYIFNGVVDIMGVMFDIEEQDVLNKKWLGNGPYRVWKNRLHGPQYGVWQNDYNDPVPGETFIYPEFKGYFSNVTWMKLGVKTSGANGSITIKPNCPAMFEAEDLKPANIVGVFQPRDGRDELLYTLPKTGISLIQVIPGVRNKVNNTDLNGPSAQPVWANGEYTGEVEIIFE